MFMGVSLPAAGVNAGLKYMQKRIQIAFMVRLTHMLHSQYCSNRAYYAASTLGGLTHADQRITEDVEKFSFSIAELYSYTFKVGAFITPAETVSTTDFVTCTTNKGPAAANPANPRHCKTTMSHAEHQFQQGADCVEKAPLGSDLPGRPCNMSPSEIAGRL